MSPSVYTLPVAQTVRTLLTQYQAQAQKSWGQHFLIDEATYRAIVEACRLPTLDSDVPAQVIEIGAGLGTLTARLLDTGWPVTAIEREPTMCRILQEQLGERPGFSLCAENALAFDGTRLLTPNAPARWWVVGNLPYNIATPLLFHWLSFRAHIERMVVMVQKEVADRMTATPGSADYGALSINLQMLSRVWQIRTVPPGCFLPPPRVDSAVVVLQPFAETRLPVKDVSRFRQVVQTAFSQRRKTIRNALKSLGGSAIDEWFAQAGVDPHCRAETLSLEKFVRLYEFLPSEGVEKFSHRRREG